MTNDLPPVPQPPVNNVPLTPPQPPMQDGSVNVPTPPFQTESSNIMVTDSKKSTLKVVVIILTILGVAFIAVLIFVFMLFSNRDDKVEQKSVQKDITGSINTDVNTKVSEEKNTTPTDVTATATIDNIKCDNEYSALIEEHGREYGEECLAGVGDMECNKSEKADLTRNVVMIIDASGSMAAKMGGKTKMEVAKTAADEFAKDLSEDINLSIVTYGHQGNNSAAGKATSCAGIEEIYWLGTPVGNVIHDKISALKANGWTPIGGALQKAEDILSKYPSTEYNNSVLLISDGEETCNGDPVSKAKELNSSNINVVVNVVGFDVGGKAESQLKSTAENGKGAYFSARNASELSAALNNVTDSCLRKGKSVAQVQANSSVLINCEAVLGGEWTSMTFAINKASDECRTYIRNKYDERYNSLKTQFKALDAQNKKNFKDAYGSDSGSSK